MCISLIVCLEICQENHMSVHTRGYYGRVYEVKTRTALRRHVFLVHRKILRQVDRRRGDVVYEPSQEEYDHFAKVYGRAKYHNKRGRKMRCS